MFFLTFDKALWAVCSAHTRPFETIAVTLDPEEYDLEGYFREFYEEESPESQ